MNQTLLEKLLAFYSLDPAAYQEEIAAPTARLSLPDWPMGKFSSAARERILKAVMDRERIICYGDYDVDGIASIAIALNALRALGANVRGYLPGREEDGYGLTVGNVEKIAKAGYSLIITLDNGITAFDAVKRAGELGVDVVIVDHHEMQGNFPPAAGIVHQKAEGFLDYGISAGLTSYLFFTALLGKKDEYLLSLAGLSTLSDQMPLMGINRRAVRLALSYIKANHYEEFDNLLPAGTDYRGIQFGLIPALNSLGRIGDVRVMNSVALNYFVRGEGEKGRLSRFIRDFNEKRKSLTKEAVTNIKPDVRGHSLTAFNAGPEGLNGLLSSKYCSETGLPCAVFGKIRKNGEALSVSFRSPEGYDILDILKSSGIAFLSLGGHAHAAGGSIAKGDLAAFRERFEEECARRRPAAAQPRAVDINYSDINMDSLRLVGTFAPFGNGFPEPLFRIAPLSSDSFTYAKEGSYLRLTLPGGAKVFSFSFGEKDFPGNAMVTFYGHLRENVFRGQSECRYEPVKADITTY